MKKKLAIFILSILIFIFFIIFFIPKLFSTKLISNYLAKKTEKKFDAKVQIGLVNFSWLGPQVFKNTTYSDKNLDLSFDLFSSNISLYAFYKSIKSFDQLKLFSYTEINNLNVTFHYPNLPESKIFNVFAKSSKPSSDTTNISITGKALENKYSGNFSITAELKNDSINANINAMDLPTIGIDSFLFYNNIKFRGTLISLLGPNMNLKASLNLKNKEGPISVDITSTNAKIFANMNLEKSNLTLNEPLVATFYLSGINPVLFDQITYSKSISNPIVLKVSNVNFSMPANFENLKKTQLENCFLDLGKILVSNTGPISTLTRFAKLSSSSKVSLWFTSANIKIQNQVIYTDRVDILIDDSLHICVWGKIDLRSETLDMNLGITKDALEDIFNIRNLPENYVIKVPIRGSVNKPKIDTSSLSAKILALSAMQSKKGIGALIGGIVSKVTEDKDIPPAKKPFPWEGSVKKSPSSPRLDLDSFFDLFK